MKYFTAALTAATAVSALSVVSRPNTAHQDVLAPADAEQYLIELGEGDTRWITEEQKWELKRVRTTTSTAKGL